MEEIEDSLDKTLGWFEQGLNVAGYFPGVASISGTLRVGLGKIEVIGAIVSAAFIAIKTLYSRDSMEREKAADILIKYSLHGLANICRGSLEIFPFLSLVTCLPYDLTGNRFVYIREPSNHPNHYYVHQRGARA